MRRLRFDCPGGMLVQQLFRELLHTKCIDTWGRLRYANANKR